MAKFVRRMAGAGASVENGLPLTGCAFADAYPALWEFLTLDEWDEDKPRVPGSLSLFTGSNGLQAALNDKDQGYVSFVSARSITALFEQLDQGIANDCLDWRRSSDAKGRKPKKSS